MKITAIQQVQTFNNNFVRPCFKGTSGNSKLAPSSSSYMGNELLAGMKLEEYGDYKNLILHGGVFKGPKTLELGNKITLYGTLTGLDDPDLHTGSGFTGLGVKNTNYGCVFRFHDANFGNNSSLQRVRISGNLTAGDNFRAVSVNTSEDVDIGMNSKVGCIAGNKIIIGDGIQAQSIATHGGSIELGNIKRLGHLFMFAGSAQNQDSVKLFFNSARLPRRINVVVGHLKGLTIETFDENILRRMRFFRYASDKKGSIGSRLSQEAINTLVRVVKKTW